MLYTISTFLRSQQEFCRGKFNVLKDLQEMFVGIKAVLNTESVASSMSYTNPSKLRICQCKTSTWIMYTGLKTDPTLMNIQREE